MIVKPNKYGIIGWVTPPDPNRIDYETEDVINAIASEIERQEVNYSGIDENYVMGIDGAVNIRLIAEAVLSRLSDYLE